MHLATHGFMLGALWQMLFMAISLGAFVFTKVYSTGDQEVYTFTSLTADTTGTLTFVNTDYLVAPDVELTPTGAGTYANSISLGATSATTQVVNQVGSIGAGLGRLTVRRRR